MAKLDLSSRRAKAAMSALSLVPADLQSPRTADASPELAALLERRRARLRLELQEAMDLMDEGTVARILDGKPREHSRDNRGPMASTASSFFQDRRVRSQQQSRLSATLPTPKKRARPQLPPDPVLASLRDELLMVSHRPTELPGLAQRSGLRSQTDAESYDPGQRIRLSVASSERVRDAVKEALQPLSDAQAKQRAAQQKLAEEREAARLEAERAAQQRRADAERAAKEAKRRQAQAEEERAVKWEQLEAQKAEREAALAAKTAAERAALAERRAEKAGAAWERVHAQREDFERHCEETLHRSFARQRAAAQRVGALHRARSSPATQQKLQAKLDFLQDRDDRLLSERVANWSKSAARLEQNRERQAARIAEQKQKIKDERELKEKAASSRRASLARERKEQQSRWVEKLQEQGIDTSFFSTNGRPNTTQRHGSEPSRHQLRLEEQRQRLRAKQQAYEGLVQTNAARIARAQENFFQSSLDKMERLEHRRSEHARDVKMGAAQRKMARSLREQEWHLVKDLTQDLRNARGDPAAVRSRLSEVGLDSLVEDYAPRR